MSTHPDTIGQITVGGTEYDIDWPHLIDSTTGPEDPMTPIEAGEAK